MAKTHPFTIVIDTREQLPYNFVDHDPELVVVDTLKTGDYSLRGLEDKVCVERKSKADAYGTIGKGRARFLRELTRMSTMDYAAIIIECTIADFLIQPPYSKLNPNSAIQSVISWSIRFGVHVHFVNRRVYGRAFTYRILEKFWRNHLKEQSEGK